MISLPVSWHLKRVFSREPPAFSRNSIHICCTLRSVTYVPTPPHNLAFNLHTQRSRVRRSRRACHRSEGQASGTLCRRTHHQVPPFNSARRVVDRVARSNEARFPRQSRVASKGQTRRRFFARYHVRDKRPVRCHAGCVTDPKRRKEGPSQSAN